jgi:hypothetical protein
VKKSDFVPITYENELYFLCFGGNDITVSANIPNSMGVSGD